MQRSDDQPPDEGPYDIALVGDLTDHETELADKLVGVPLDGEVTLYFDSPGGSPYCALALTTIIMVRRLNCTGIVAGECSSAALWPLAACRRRIVTPYSVLLFHPMKWQSDEHVMFPEAAEWARHFAQLEQQMDTMLARLFGVAPDMLAEWAHPGRYVSGREAAAAGLAELFDFPDLAGLHSSSDATKRPRGKR